MFNNQVKIKLLVPQIRFSVKLLHQQSSFSAHQNEPELPPQPSSTKFSNHHIYSNIFNWSRLNQFADHLMSNILYSDYDIVAITKPFGVGIHNPYDKSNRPDKIEPKLFGDPRYCIADVLPVLSEKLNAPELSICITSDRILSGIVVLAKTPKAQKRVKYIFQVARKHHHPCLTFHCLTHGAPMMKEPIVKETVTIQETCVNERTGEVEPEILYNLPKKRAWRYDDTKRVTTELKVLDYNTSLNVALVEISCNRHNFNFVRCYLASKACFILGDPRFSRRVGYILGVPYSLKPANKRPREEPLTNSIRKILNVPNNKSIPFMLHQVGLSIGNYTKHTDVNIENYTYPKHFIWTMNKLLTTKYQ